ncbi:MAG TPA: hypothetical protein VG755_36775 [Nannocystaceae bacterium]|nr:hypothetical protein [Nannocystaceae bacterium]
MSMLALVIGCGSDLREDPMTVTGSASASMSASAEGSSSADSSGSGTTVVAETSDEGMTKLDVGVATSGATLEGGDDMSGCDKVDFLFIVDNSGSMYEEQVNLISSFPQFIGTIQDTLDEAQDYHIMVLDTDAWVYSACPLLCGFPLPPGVNPCEGFECMVTEPEECEDVLGAGVTWPKGGQSSNMDCMFASGERWMDANQPDLSATFECAARVGTGSTGDPERPMEAMVQAATSSTPAFACNEGFFRDDAILVVTFITDEDDDAADGSGGTVDGWRQALIAAKNGDETAVVVLGLFGDGDQLDPICDSFDSQSGNGAEPSPRLRQFVESWGTRGFAGSICAPSYDAFFEEAVGIIDTTCDEFQPPAG